MTEKRETIEIGDASLDYLFDENQDEGVESSAVTEEQLEMYRNYDMRTPIPGKTIEATLVGESDDDFLFDANCKDYIRVSRNKTEFAFLEGHKYGDLFEIAIMSVYNDPFWIKGSIAALYEAQVHEELKALDADQYIDAYVKEMTPAGYNMTITHNHITLEAFMPHTLAGINKLHENARKQLVGQSLRVMIESYAGDKGTYIVSRRKYLNQLKPKEIKKLNTEDVYTGHVTGTTPFGVFVEFNECLTGMIHKSNIHPDWQDKIQQIEAGTEIDFFVKEIIRDKKIILTQIQKESLWDNIGSGDIIDGIVRDHKNFGILVNLDEETMGLIHTSEIGKVGGVKADKGDKVSVKVLAVDRMNRKIFLTPTK
jgi:ribosomal protein S1